MDENKQKINMLVGANIKRERERVGYTQDEFSEMIGLWSKSLSAAERGVVGVSISTLLKICQVLSVSSDTILFEKVQENDVQAMTRRLERLTPEQFAIAEEMLGTLLKAFSIEK